MHRGAFRPRKRIAGRGNAVAYQQTHDPRSFEHSSDVEDDLSSLREQIENIGQKIMPMRAAMETLVSHVQHDSKTVPNDLGKAVRELVNQVSSLERSFKSADKRLSTMENSFSKALLRMGDQVERVSGGADSKFDLAYAMEQLIKILSSRSYRVIRDNDSNMVGLETDEGRFDGDGPQR